MRGSEVSISVVKCSLVKFNEVLQCNDGTSNKVSNIIRRHIGYHTLSYSLGTIFINIWLYSCLIPCNLIVRPCILNVVYVFLLLSMYSYGSSMYSYCCLCCSSMYSYCCLCILILVYVFLDAATLTEVFPCFFLGCKANSRV